ncbi:MAG: S-methyl-5-thioribose kinase [Burkholderiaceae bacterium]
MSALQDTPEGYVAHNPESLRQLLAGLPDLSARLGGDASSWTITEVGDGNLNLVFIVKGREAGVAVKQALPYVRLVGESWPLPLSRAHYEHLALSEQALHVPHLVPRIYHYDRTLALIVMELFEPHIIMRHGMIAGTVYPKFADDIASFMAENLFRTSDLAITADHKKELIAAFAGNTALCKITEDLIFTEPYQHAENNRWTQPWLDPWAAAIRGDSDLKLAVSRLKIDFMGKTQAMLHGDLHTGSVMLTENSTKIIDPEFAFVGPMGFDIGAVLANLLINYFSQVGYETEGGGRDAYREWVLDTIEQVWLGFRARFLNLWRSSAAAGDAYPATLFTDAAGRLALENERELYMDALLQDSLGFAGAKMNRRILGLAHNIDLENIADERLRASAEARVLTLARELIVNTHRFTSIGSVTDAARRTNAWADPLTDQFGQKGLRT